MPNCILIDRLYMLLYWVVLDVQMIELDVIFFIKIVALYPSFQAR